MQFLFQSSYSLVYLLITICRCTQIKTHAWSNASVVLVGNKSDLDEGRVIDESKGHNLAMDLGKL